MAPSAVRPESPTAYSHPLKQARQGPALSEVQTSTNAHISVNNFGNDNGHVNGSNGIHKSNGHEPRPQNNRDVVTSQFLLEQSQKIASGGGPNSSKPPNILYIMADQMTAPLLKMNNPNSVIKTPNLDKLAETGVVFSSAYCNSPLCAPSRFTMCTGQLPSKIGGYDNASILAPEVPTYAHYLRAEGYETALAGKMHFIGPDQLHGFEHRQVTSTNRTTTSNHEADLPQTSILLIWDGQ